MPTYFYCVVPAGSVTPDSNIAGIGDARVRALSLGPLAAAWVSTVDAAPRTAERAERRALGLAHDRVVTAALDAGVTPVPARAGQVFEDDDDCRARLEERIETYRRALARLGGLVEMTASVELAGVAPPPQDRQRSSGDAAAPGAESGPGTRHLFGLRSRAREGDHMRAEALEIAAELSALVRDLTLDVAVRAHAHRRPGVAVSHLVSRTDAEEYRLRLADRRCGLHRPAVVTGPTAPYSFASNPADSLP